MPRLCSINFQRRKGIHSVPYIEHQNLEKLSAFVDCVKKSFPDFYISVSMNDSGKKRGR